MAEREVQVVEHRENRRALPAQGTTQREHIDLVREVEHARRLDALIATRTSAASTIDVFTEVRNPLMAMPAMTTRNEPVPEARASPNTMAAVTIPLSSAPAATVAKLPREGCR